MTTKLTDAQLMRFSEKISKTPCIACATTNTNPEHSITANEELAAEVTQLACAAEAGAQVLDEVAALLAEIEKIAPSIKMGARIAMVNLVAGNIRSAITGEP